VASEVIDNTDPPDVFIDSVIQAPVVLVVSVDLEVVAAFDQNLDRIGLVSGASVYPLVWNVLLAARNEGYGRNLTTMAVPQEAQVRELLGLPDTHALAAVVPLGKPTRQQTKLRRRSVEETVTCEHFDGAPFTRSANPVTRSGNPRKFLGGLRRAWVPLVVVVAVVIGDSPLIVSMECSDLARTHSPVGEVPSESFLPTSSTWPTRFLAHRVPRE